MPSGKNYPIHIFVPYFLCSHPRSFDPSVTAFEARETDHLSLTFVKNKLNDEHKHRCENREMHTNPRDSAYKAINKSENRESISSLRYSEYKVVNKKARNKKFYSFANGITM